MSNVAPNPLAGESRRAIVANGYTTNLSDSFTLPYRLSPYPDYGDAPIEHLEAVPHLLDELSVGAFVLSHQRMSGPETTKDVSIKDTDLGRVVNFGAFSTRTQREHTALKSKWGDSVLSLVGFVFEGDELTSVPLPSAVQSNVETLGVNVRLLPDSAEISRYDYLEAFEAKEYPVATLDESYYLHDIGNDHLPGVIAGGEVLAASLARAARRALSSKEPRILRSTVYGIDSYTARISNYVSTHMAGDDTPGEPNGERMGITQAETLDTVEFAVNRASHKFPL